MKHGFTILTTLLLASTVIAEDGCCSVGADDKPPSRGLSIFANAGGYWADKVTANFYSGRPENKNTIDRVLHSNTHGRQIWQNLRNQRLITDAVGNETQMQVVEYPDMYYRISYQVGLGLHYEYASGFGWLLRADMARLQAIGAFNLSADGNVGLLGRDQYVRCNMLGREDRINIDIALTKTVNLSRVLDLEVDLGASLINTQVRENAMAIGGGNYSILDVWDGRTPDEGVASYNYVNQGGIGYGVFASVLLGYYMPSIGAFKLGYTCYQSQTVLQGYTAWGWQHMLGVRIEINNFSFIE